MKKIYKLLLIPVSLLAKPFWDYDPSEAIKQLQSMTVKEKIAQLIMPPIYPDSPEPVTERLIKEYHVGNFIFMSGHAKNQSDLAEYYQSISKFPLMFAQDNECGRVHQVKDFPVFPSNLTMGAIQNDIFIRRVGVAMGRLCKSVNVHLNFAPVLDINNNVENPVINDRSFGENKFNVADNGIAFIEGMQREGVLACAKHYPGHGDVNIDSHLDLPVVDKSLEELEQMELYPFKEAIKAEVEAIMTAHILFPQIDDLPATLSSKIIEDLDFKGLIVTDALNMKGITKQFSLEEVALMALIAGHDILLFALAKPHPEEMFEYVTGTIDRIYEAVQNNVISEEEIDGHVMKILMAKQKVLNKTGLNVKQRPIRSTKPLQRLLYEKAITLVKNENVLPFSKLETYPTAVVQIGGDLDSPFVKKLKTYCDLEEFYLDPNAEQEEIDEILQSVNENEYVIVSLHDMNRFAKYDWGITDTTMRFLSLLKPKTILTIFGSPYSLSKFDSASLDSASLDSANLDSASLDSASLDSKSLDSIIMAYEDTYYAQIAAAKLIGGDLNPEGKLPVTASKLFVEGYGLSY